MRGREYEARGGRETLGEAIAEAANIPRDEADRIAASPLLSWAAHISDTEVSEAREARRWFLGFTIVVGLFAIAFIALLVLVLVTLVF